MEQELVKCYFCGGPVTDENYCHGCGEYICEKCVLERPGPFGKHGIDDHELTDEW